MTDQPTYTETLAQNNEVMSEILAHFRNSESRGSAGILESQLDHVIRSVGELKAEVRHNREIGGKQFNALGEDISQIKQDCRATAEWRLHEERRVESVESDIDGLRERVNKMAAGNGVIAVIGSVLAAIIGTQS